MTEKMTRFDPVQNGLRFSNTFATDIIWGPMHITTGGRCGGISYTALDCFFDGEKIPSDTTRPPEGAVLNTYIYERQMKSLAGTADQWVDFLTNPFGLRTGEPHNRGRRGGGEFQKLIGEIDAGRPCNLCLVAPSPAPGQSHQVIAFGYDTGAGGNDLEIYFCDPNHPNKICVLFPDAHSAQYRYRDQSNNEPFKRGGRDVTWIAYFADTDYVKRNPPNWTDEHAANLVGRNFSNQNLDHRDFRNDNLMGANFSGANLTQCLIGFVTQGTRANFERANLEKADLRNSIIPNAKFRFANLSYATLNTTTVRHGDFSYATLCFSDLRCANFRNTKLCYANLMCSDMRSANFAGESILGVPVNMIAADIVGDRVGLGTGQFEDYLIQDLIPYVDSNYRTIPDRASRGTDGFSAGAYSAIMIAIKHPELFISAGCYDGPFGWTSFDDPGSSGLLDDSMWMTVSNFDPFFGKPRDVDYMKLHNPANMIAGASPDDVTLLKSMQFLIHAAGEDGNFAWLEGTYYPRTKHVVDKLALRRFQTFAKCRDGNVFLIPNPAKPEPKGSFPELCGS